MLRKVYVIDAEIRAAGLSSEARLREHRVLSKPHMESLREWMDEQMNARNVEPNGALGSAIQYMTTRWTKMTRFLEVAGAPLDNNACYAARGISRVMPTSELCRVELFRRPYRPQSMALRHLRLVCESA